MSRKIPFLEMFAALSRRADLADAVQGWLIVSAAIDRASREAVITLEGAGGALTQAELDYLPWGAKLMTLECGIRFLTDYLDGDHYFRIHREGQNLDRCRTQFKLVADMEEQWEAMKAVVDKYP